MDEGVLDPVTVLRLIVAGVGVLGLVAIARVKCTHASTTRGLDLAIAVFVVVIGFGLLLGSFAAID